MSVPPTTTRVGSPGETASLQYTSGTSSGMPSPVVHSHRSLVTIMNAAIFALGIRPGDSFFCPSSPAWGHGLWPGTLAPLALGVPTGTVAGKFTVDKLAFALGQVGVTNMSAAATVFRMINADHTWPANLKLQKATYTGEGLDAAAQHATLDRLGVLPRGMYGSTEVGVIIGNYPGFVDYEYLPGALGKPLPGLEVAVVDPAGQRVVVGEIGEIAVRRRGAWIRTRDAGREDELGYFWHQGRSDDVIISSGWTISPSEVEAALRRHPDVEECAVVGVPDALRGLVVQAFVIKRRGSDATAEELQTLVRSNLSAHEYPRRVEFVDELPRTPNGKIDRSKLRTGEGLVILDAGAAE